MRMVDDCSVSWEGSGRLQTAVPRAKGKQMNLWAALARGLLHYLGNSLRAVHLAFLRLHGVQIGHNTMISLGAKIDTRRGRVIIGDNCLITHGVKILSHDGAMRLIDPSDDGSGTTRIGNNVFVGVNAVILRNVVVGDNSVVAAGAIVVRDVPPATVVAGNPARVIKELQGPFQVLNNPKH